MALTLALTGGSFIFLAFVIVLFFGAVYGLYTRRGSAINEHPNDGLDGAPGAKTPDGISGASPTNNPDAERDAFSEHGTR